MNRDRSAHPVQLAWLDVFKGLAILWIVGNHVAERIWGGPYFANPIPSWPPLAERLAQAAPLGQPLADAARWIGWLGDQGVQMFLIASGFGLAWSMLGRPDAPWRTTLGWFYRRRLLRLYPMWWGAHVLVLAPAFLLGWGVFALDSRLVFSLLGLRLTAPIFYYLFPAWWFIGLILQLYLVFPLLWAWQRRWGPGRYLAAAVGIGILSRAAGLLVAGGGLDPWLRGIVCVTRLPEFALGMALAVWWHGGRRPRPILLPLALVVWVAGNALSFFWYGNTVAPLLTGAGLVGMFLALAPSARTGRVAPGERPLAWVGRHSYAIFLVHHPLVLLLMPARTFQLAAWVATLLLIVPAALLLEAVTARATAAVRGWWERGGWPRVVWRLALAVGAVVAFGFGLEAAVRRFDPQEVHGWGERESLRPDPQFDYRLAPDGDFRLRWLGYDYRVQTNALGFPGPAYPEAKPAGVLRILTLGDAFTSAEGVDTELAWPRRLEDDLNARPGGPRAEVLNFAVTGYGPQHYAALAAEYVPRFHPDLVIVGFFVNEYDDITFTAADYHAGIGFAAPPQHGWRSWTRPYQLRAWFRNVVTRPVREILTGKHGGPGLYWGQFAQFEVDRLPPDDARVLAVKEKLAAIRDVSRANGAEVLLLLIPASVQVEQAADLPYIPRGVDLADTTRYCLDCPQRLTIALAQELDLPWLDLRSVLRPGSGQRYYPRRNMHWTPAAHATVAAALAERLASAPDHGSATH